MRNKPLFLLGAVCCFVLLLAGCASQSAFSRSFGGRLTETQNDWKFHYGRYFNPDAAALSTRGGAYLPIDNSQLQLMMNRIVYVSPLRGYPVRVAVVGDPKPNAFTAGGQTVFITTGLLQIFQNNPDVIASVLAHELGHILGHHTAEEKSRTSALEAFSFLTPALGALPYGGLYAGAAGAALREGAKMERFSYNRAQENEADAAGVYLACKAGYRGMGLSAFFDVVKSSGFGLPQTISIPTSLGAIPQSAVVTLLSSSPLYRVHPPSEKRKRTVELVLARCEGKMSQEELREKSSWLADFYKNIEYRSPKSAPEKS